MKSNLYFLALIPPSPIAQEALAFKNYFREHYQSKASLNSPPHITLHMPFDWRPEKEPPLKEKLLTFAVSQNRFTVKLENFGCFAPRVIFIRVIEGTQLSSLQLCLHRFCKTELNLFNAQFKDLPFHPHLTVAFRDLKKPAFFKAWEEFKEKPYASEFEADKIALLKHDGRRWDVADEFSLG
jgi:2'-5' RNA ligase